MLTLRAADRTGLRGPVSLLGYTEHNEHVNVFHGLAVKHIGNRQNKTATQNRKTPIHTGKKSAGALAALASRGFTLSLQLTAANVA